MFGRDWRRRNPIRSSEGNNTTRNPTSYSHSITSERSWSITQSTNELAVGDRKETSSTNTSSMPDPQKARVDVFELHTIHELMDLRALKLWNVPTESCIRILAQRMKARHIQLKSSNLIVAVVVVVTWTEEQGFNLTENISFWGQSIDEFRVVQKCRSKTKNNYEMFSRELKVRSAISWPDRTFQNLWV